MSRPIVLVTGASAGIGAAAARLAARDGYDVAINYRTDRDGADKAAEAVRNHGGRAFVVQADVADPAAVGAMFEAVDSELGTLDALVNNAGIIGEMARVDELSPNRLNQMFAVNIAGSFHCAREAVRRMSTRHGGKGGSIVNLSSVAALLGAPGQYVDYGASKGAIDTLTIGLANEVAAEGIRVNAVRPGIIDTEIHAKGGLPDRAREMAGSIPMKRPGTAEEVAEAILWLMSDKASYVTGEIMKVTGGR